MKKHNKGNYEVYRGIRKPMPPPTKVIPTAKDKLREKKFNWHKESKVVQKD